MGIVQSLVSRQFNKFNVENRAQKIISQDKPKPAPKFDSNLRDLERVLQEYPELINKQNKKDELLDDYLKHVYVTSTRSEPTRQRQLEYALPLDRSAVDDFEFGHLEPQKVSKGRCTLRQAMEFISNHQTDPSQWNAAAISKRYDLKENLVNDILKHFKPFELHLPENKQKGKAFPNTSNQNKLLN
ncbi:protein NDUFAF4 homolog [Culex quinquefasciatus]|uniref:protein NDUFAF4 homolog n=1 Tax=Culex quinquefasciatus TaxID=7176 RepID=UPI0018E366B9|nr:protein NDUFAF4 homolog [Culex quinquefasciatus]XP_039448989.1 protein NDUFAF4 homolog [Culex pipiens pallens]